MTFKKLSFLKLVSLFILFTICFLLLFGPTITKNITVKNSKEWFGRSISLETLKFNPFTGTIKLYDLKVFEEDNITSFLKFDTLIINTIPYKLLGNTIEIEEFKLTGVQLNIEKTDSIFNFNDLLIRYTSTDSITDTNSSSYDFIMSDFELKQSRIQYIDTPLNDTIQFNRLNFKIPYIALNKEDRSDISIHFNINDSASIYAELKYNPLSKKINSTLKINNLNIHDFQNYVTPYMSISSINGYLNTTAIINGSLDSINHINIKNDLEITNFMLKDTEGKDVLGSKSITVQTNNFSPADSNFTIDNIKITTPYVHFLLEDSTNNFLQLFNIPNTVETVNPENETVNYHYSLTKEVPALKHLTIKKININDGILDYADHLTSEKFSYHLSKIEMQSENITTQTDWLDFKAKMLLNNRGTLNANFGFNPDNLYTSTLKIDIEKFLLSDLNIYTKHYMGHEILEGDMYYYSTTTIKQGQLESTNQLIIKNSKLNNSNKGLFNLPLRFALFLLRDKDGIVKLEIPLRGDLNDPEIRIGKIVWNTFKGLILKAVNQPGKLLGSLITDKSIDINSINFNYNDTTLTPAQLKQLDALLELEVKKPGLSIQLEYFTNLAKEKEVTTLTYAIEKYTLATNQKLKNDSSNFKQYLQDFNTNNNNNSTNLYENYLFPLSIDSIMGYNTQLKNEKIIKYVKSQDISSQITILPHTLDTDTISNPYFKIIYDILE